MLRVSSKAQLNNHSRDPGSRENVFRLFHAPKACVQHRRLREHDIHMACSRSVPVEQTHRSGNNEPYKAHSRRTRRRGQQEGGKHLPEGRSLAVRWDQSRGPLTRWWQTPVRIAAPEVAWAPATVGEAVDPQSKPTDESLGGMNHDERRDLLSSNP
jgi:hypothetical protein